MNLLNEKARVLRTQITAEKNKKKPDYTLIKNLENELKFCLKNLKVEL